MLCQSELGEDGLWIALQDFIGSRVLIEREKNRDQTLDDVCITIALKVHAASAVLVTDAGRDPNLACASADLVGIGTHALGEFGQLPAKLNNVPVAILPVIEEGKIVGDLFKRAQCHYSALQAMT